MFSTLWIIAGTAAYAVVATGLFLRLRNNRRHAILFVILAVLAYVPFIGYPFLKASLRQEESAREIAALRVAVLKRDAGILDTATGAPKEDRYLDARELRTLIAGLAATLPPAGAEPAPACHFLYLYAYYLERPDLTVSRKWYLSMDMPRPFYTADGGVLADPEIQSGTMAREVRNAWDRLGHAADAPAGLGRCPGPP